MTDAATRSAWSGAAGPQPVRSAASETSGARAPRARCRSTDQVPGYRQQPGPGVAGALGEDLRVTPGPQEDFLGDVGGAVVVLQKKTGGVVQHDLPVLLVQGPEHGLVERLAARPARSGLDRTLRPFTWFIPSGSGFLDRPRRIAGPAMLLWNTAHDAGGFR